MCTVKITIESAAGTRTRTVRNASAEHVAHLRNWARTNTPTGGACTFTTEEN